MTRAASGAAFWLSHTYYSTKPPPRIATATRRSSDSHAPLSRVKPAAVLFSARYTAASPLSSVFWSYPRPEKILDKNGRGQLCLGTLSEGLQEPDRINAEVGKGSSDGTFLGDSHQTR
jgi:hypothetical protein